MPILRIVLSRPKDSLSELFFLDEPGRLKEMLSPLGTLTDKSSEKDLHSGKLRLRLETHVSLEDVRELVDQFVRDQDFEGKVKCGEDKDEKVAA